MSEGDFEVMPRGTIEEVRALRKFANDIIRLAHEYDNIIPKDLLNKIEEVDSFYAAQIGRAHV